jgi:hypothetical protein
MNDNMKASLALIELQGHTNSIESLRITCSNNKVISTSGNINNVNIDTSPDCQPIKVSFNKQVRENVAKSNFHVNINTEENFSNDTAFLNNSMLYSNNVDNVRANNRNPSTLKIYILLRGC